MSATTSIARIATYTSTDNGSKRSVPDFLRANIDYLADGACRYLRAPQRQGGGMTAVSANRADRVHMVVGYVFDMLSAGKSKSKSKSIV